MKIKKILFASLTAIIVIASCAFAAVLMTPRVGFLTRLNTTEEEFSQIIQNSETTTGWHLLSNRHELYGVKFYDSLTSMLMALDKRDIEEVALPDIVAEYIVKSNHDFEVCCVSYLNSPMSLAFGFRKDNAALAEKFNSVLSAMEEDWSLPEVQGVYLYSDNRTRPVEFTHYDGADTIRAAVTGDLPPIDFIDAGGKPSGFNTALLSEIGRRLKVNVELVNIEAGARNAALSSGRVDVVFWYETAEKFTWNLDAPEGVILSKPYYSWNKFLHIRKK